jgi:hypothetical protein
MKNRNIDLRVAQSMPDTITTVTSTATFAGGVYCAFMIPSNSDATITKLEINGVDKTADKDDFPRDVYILGNVTNVIVSAGKVFLWS